MKTFTDEAKAALASGAVVASAFHIACDPPCGYWSGHGSLTIDGFEFLGLGDNTFAQVSAGALGSAATAATLQVSGIEPAALALFDAAGLRGAEVVLWRLIFDPSGTILLDAQVFQRGRLDQLPVEETPGGGATIKALIETAARGLGRAGGRMRSDADQRLIDAEDAGMSRITYAGQKTLYWGGKPPQSAAQALPGASVG